MKQLVRSLPYLAFATLAFARCGGDDSGSGAGGGRPRGSGGSTTGSGGATGTGTGGRAGTGGTTGSGGTTGAGATTGSGGTPATGGAPGSGGTTASGGGAGMGGTAGPDASTGGTGGAAGTGGSAGTGGRGGGAGAPGTGGGTAADAARDTGAPSPDGGTSPMMNFFVTSDTHPNGNLGGLSGADQRCQTLAAAVGQGSKTWRAYLSVDTPATNARDRIGEGPYYNSQGVMIAATKAALHARGGDPALFIDEHGARINGQWNGGNPNEHDMWTGSTAAGMLNAGMTCANWTNMTAGNGIVGHSDGLGPNMSDAGALNSWNAAHGSSCANPVPAGGVGRIYCFVGP